LTQNEVVALWEKKHGQKLEVTHVTGSELEAREKEIPVHRVHNYWTQWPEFVQVSESLFCISAATQQVLWSSYLLDPGRKGTWSPFATYHSYDIQWAQDFGGRHPLSLKMIL
jgi:hypothetical protein